MSTFQFRYDRKGEGMSEDKWDAWGIIRDRFKIPDEIAVEVYFSELEAKLKEKDETIAAIKLNRRNLRREYNAQMEKARRRADADKGAEVEAHIRMWTHSVEMLEAKLKERDAECQGLSLTIEDLKVCIDGGNKKVGELEASYAELDEDYVQLEAKLKEREQQIVGLQDTLAGRELSLKQMDAAYDARLADLRGLVKAVKEMMTWGVELDDERLKYIVAQVYRRDIEVVEAALEALEAKE